MGDRYRLFSNIPFSVLFEPEPEWQDTSNFFFKTSIDYVLCTDAGKPLIAVDFDGLGGGFDKDGRYLQVNETSDPQRKLKFDFKLRYAEQHDFPYHVVASPEFDEIDQDIALTLVDGIIGHELARSDFQERATSVLEAHSEKIEDLDSDFKGDYIQSLLNGVETETLFEHDPITRKWGETLREIQSITGIYSVGKEKWEFRTGFRSPGDVRLAKNLEELSTAQSGEAMVDCKHTIFHSEFGEVSEFVALRDVFGYSGAMAQDIAQLLTYRKLLRLLQEQHLTA